MLCIFFIGPQARAPRAPDLAAEIHHILLPLVTRIQYTHNKTHVVVVIAVVLQNVDAVLLT